MMGAPRRSSHDDPRSYLRTPSRALTPVPTLIINPTIRPISPNFRQVKRMRRAKNQEGEHNRSHDAVNLAKNVTRSASNSDKNSSDSDKNSSDSDKNDKSSSSQSQQNGTSNAQPNPFFLCPQCVIRDNDPHVSYVGAWTLNGTQAMTQHSTTLSGSTISLKFNGSGIVVFGTVPASDANNPPPTAVYTLDDQPFPTTLPFAVSDVQSQPLFASMTVLSNQEHRIAINITSASVVPYIFESFFIFPMAGSNKDVVGQVPTSVMKGAATSIPTNTNSTLSTPSMQSASPNTSHTSYDPQKIIRILAGFLGTLIFLLVGGIVAYAIVRRRFLVKKAGKIDKERPDTIYTNFTSTESIMRYDSGIWSPFRSPRRQSQYSRSDGRNGHSTQSTSLRTSTDNIPHLPPLPPKPAILTSTIQR